MLFDTNEVSAVIPTCNNEDTITQAIECLIANESNEIIIVDAGSQDRTLDLVSRFARVRTIRIAADTPLGEARQIGWRQSSGKVILFLDADAYLQGDALKRLIQVINTSDLAVVSCRIACANPEKLLPHFRDVDFRLAYPEGFEDRRVIKCAFDPTICGLFRRDALDSVGGFDMRYRYGEDLEILGRLESKGYRAVTVFDPAVYHYHRENLHDLYMQLYHHGMGRRAVISSRGSCFYRHKNPTIFAKRLIQNIRASELPIYILYRIFTETAFLMGYINGQ